MESSVLENVTWSKECLCLSEFVQRYKLPQLVLVEEGVYNDDENSSFSSGEILKLQSVDTDKKVLCYDVNGFSYSIPLSIPDGVVMKHNSETVYQHIADLAVIKPLPKYVKFLKHVIANGNEDYEIIVSAGAICEVVHNIHTKTLSKDQIEHNYMSFRLSSGQTFQLPFTCGAGFVPKYENKVTLLKEILPEKETELINSFTLRFTNPKSSYFEAGELKCVLVFSKDVVKATCGGYVAQHTYNIPIAAQLYLRVANGTITGDKVYQSICTIHPANQEDTDTYEKMTEDNPAPIASRRRPTRESYTYMDIPKKCKPELYNKNKTEESKGQSSQRKYYSGPGQYA